MTLKFGPKVVGGSWKQASQSTLHDIHFKSKANQCLGQGDVSSFVGEGRNISLGGGELTQVFLPLMKPCKYPTPTYIIFVDTLLTSAACLLVAAKFYRALAHYNPHLQSPNKEFADEELAFLEDDIIIVSVKNSLFRIVTRVCGVYCC